MFKNLLLTMIKNNKAEAIEPNNRYKIEQIKEYLGGIVSPSYMTYLEVMGHGLIEDSLFEFNGTGKTDPPALIYDDMGDKELYKKNKLPAPPPTYILLSNIGDDIQWYFDLSTRRKDGECKVVGWWGGRSLEEQPDWVKEEESYETFEEFFRVKALGEEKKKIV